jgi:hypothetical protein
MYCNEGNPSRRIASQEKADNGGGHQQRADEEN